MILGPAGPCSAAATCKGYRPFLWKQNEKLRNVIVYVRDSNRFVLHVFRDACSVWTYIIIIQIHISILF